MKRYKNIKEINKDLKLLKLETEIYQQQASIDFTYIRKDLTLTNLLTELFSILSSSYFYKKLGTKLYDKLGVNLNQFKA